jgi:antitoxin YefM
MNFTGKGMTGSVSYSHAREHLAEIWNEVEDTRDAAVIQRRGHEDMALIPADELASLRETAYLLRSPANAARLLAALARARGKTGKSQSLAALRIEFGLDEAIAGR